MALTQEQEDAIDTKLSEMNLDEMNKRYDELDDKVELDEVEQYEYDELEERIDSLTDAEDEYEDEDEEIGPHDADKDN